VEFAKYADAPKTTPATIPISDHVSGLIMKPRISAAIVLSSPISPIVLKNYNPTNAQPILKNYSYVNPLQSKETIAHHKWADCTVNV